MGIRTCLNEWLDRPPTRLERIFFELLSKLLNLRGWKGTALPILLGGMLYLTIFHGPQWIRAVREDYQSSVRFEEILRTNMIAAAPRGTEPTGEIWVRSRGMPWLARMGMTRRRNFKVFKTDAEALTILRPMIGRPVYLQSTSWIASYPGILAEIHHINPEPGRRDKSNDMLVNDMLVVESRFKKPDPDLGDYPTMIDVGSVGAIYAYREK